MTALEVYSWQGWARQRVPLPQLGMALLPMAMVIAAVSLTWPARTMMLPASQPNAAHQGVLMPEASVRLLVVLDESELGLRAAAMGAALAARVGGEITMHVPIPIEHIEARSAATAMQALGQHQENCRQRTAEWFARAHAIVEPYGVATKTVMTMDEDPCAAVLRIADEFGCGLIVVGSQGRGTVSRVLGGSLVAELVRQSHLPLLVCREDMTSGWLAGA
ncbi:MAG: universal stress protein [Aquincola sp.]|nr:universal stress protein [Aquincola sp.]